MQKILIPIYRFVWSYWISEDDDIVKVLGFKTALIDRHGQRYKSQPCIWKTIKNKIQ